MHSIQKYLIAVLTVSTFFLTSGLFGQAMAQTDRNVAEYNLQNGLGLKGYDPVSYFEEGGSRPQVGQSSFGYSYGGVIYYFANAANLDAFVKHPEKYEPTYGGWCAYAMASGSRVDIQPSIYTIHGERIHFFVSRRAKQNFDSDIAGYEKRADRFWKQISGEEPRL